MKGLLSALLVAIATHGSYASPEPPNPPIRTIHTFPNNTFLENIAVRANGNLLLTSVTVPSLFTIDPTTTNPPAPALHTFPNATGLTGITEITPDIFALVTGTWDLSTGRAALGSIAIWTVDFTTTLLDPTSSPKVNFVTTIAESTVINGLARHPTNPRLLLAADSARGAIWRVDVLTGAVDVAFEDAALFTLTGTESGKNLGINGLKARVEHGKGYVYFGNLAKGLFGRVRVDAEGGKVGDGEVLATRKGVVADMEYDDFAFETRKNVGGRKEGHAVWMAAHPSYLVRVDLRSGEQWVVNDTEKLSKPTSAAFGRGSRKQERTLYVTNGGEQVEGNLVNERLLAVDLGGC
ncbi:uncharacterized protein C8A04DRAFT_28875 [Dichotomopilus funicola]|uniref:Uncharacterized protein n=1 Tax=Dichotomopilus funicola TaxID=1934379 RepID=A0AAN6ZLA3_9PEZI|nr:hypothetical protein C8A04DRAFT_28875 [Dichotomopilus funicola]